MSAAPPPAVDIAVSVESGGWGDPGHLAGRVRRVVDAVWADLGPAAAGPTELSVVFSGDEAVRALNRDWRGKDRPTNVLSFPAFPGHAGIPPMLGDIVLAYETVAREAELEGKPFDHHLCHLVAHGLLHLLGRDHATDAEAEEMEAAERRVLASLAIPDPYALTDGED